MNLGFAPKLVVITGAGASVPLNMPTTAGFLEVLKRHHSIDQQLLQQAIAASANIVASTQMQVVDVESLLDYLSSFSSGAPALLAETQISLPTGQRDDIIRRAKAYDGLREQILATIVDTYGAVDPDKAVHLLHALTYGLAKCFDINTIPVFTLNYDLAFETYVDQFQPKIEIIDGFDRAPSTLIREWSKDVFSASIAKPLAPETELRIVLFKLHGSANWGRHAPSRKLHQMGLVGRDPGEYETVLYYPSLNQKPTYQEPFQTAFDYFLECIRQAESIVIIGTAFRDKPVTDILMRAKPDCQIVVCGLTYPPPSFVDQLPPNSRWSFYVNGDFGLSSTRYRIVHESIYPWSKREGINRFTGHDSSAPIIDSIPYAGLQVIGRRPNAILEGDIIAGPAPDWYLVSGGARCHIPDIPTFEALGFYHGSIIPFVEDSLGLPIGKPLQSLVSDGVLIQSPSSADVFLVLNGTACQVLDPTAIEVLKFINPEYGNYAQNEVCKDVSEDTFQSLTYGDPVRDLDFSHCDLNGNPQSSAMAVHSILSDVANNPLITPDTVKEDLAFSSERVLLAIILNLLRGGKVEGESRQWWDRKEGYSLKGVRRISNLPRSLRITDPGRSYLKEISAAPKTTA